MQCLQVLPMQLSSTLAQAVQGPHMLLSVCTFGHATPASRVIGEDGVAGDSQLTVCQSLHGHL